MPDVRVYPDLDALSRAAADLFQQAVAECAARDCSAFVAVSGGSTPKRLFQLLAGPPWRDSVAWSHLQLYWVDERPVPKDHPDSNFRLVNENLLSSIPLPPTSVHPVPTELGAPAQAAEAYQRELEATLPRTGDGWPRFDLILLGMGDDGHTASLFPHSPGLSVTDRWVIANPVEKLGVERISLTFPVINHAAHVAFLISGDAKREPLQRVLNGPQDVENTPSSGIHPTDGTLTFLVDEAAVGK